MNGYSYVTINSRSRRSSTTLIELRVRAVRPMVSMKVLWKETSEETTGKVVLYLTFLGNNQYLTGEFGQ